MSKERELLKRVRDTLRGLEETHYDLYWDIQAELDLAPQKREPAQTAREMYQRGYAKAKDDLKREQDVVIQKLTEHLERVLFAWGMGRPLSEENDLYMNAHYYLKGLKDDAND